MSDGLELALRTVSIGIGATLLIDLWAVFLRCAFRIRSLDYRLVGRWLGHMRRGRFVHESIAAAAPIRGELAIGWSAHYAIGITFAAVLSAIWGLDWARDPTPLPPLIVGLVTVAAPFLLMQPGMGAGIAASKTPHPNVARLRSVLTHAVFGIGLYALALLVA